MARKRRRFDAEFKRHAVALANEPGHSLSQVARDLGITPGQLCRWRKQLAASGEKAFPGEGNARDAELARLRRELRRVTEERDILKAAVAIFSEPKR